MQLDQLVSARQIRQPVTSFADIGAAFDNITYLKGSAVLSMFESFIGDDEFKRGIQNYMRKHRYANADARDFVQAIAEMRPDLPEGQVEAAFFSFLDQPGTPLVDLDWQCSDQQETTVSVAQSRSLPLGSSGNRNVTWELPLCVAFDDAGEIRQQCELIEQRQTQFKLQSDVCPTFIIPNADAAGYYLWTQSVAQWQALFDSNVLNQRELLAAVNSVSAAFHAGELSINDYFSLLPTIVANENARVISAPLADLQFIQQDILNPEQRQTFTQLVSQVFRPLYNSVAPDKTLTDYDQIRLRMAMYELYALMLSDTSLREQLHQQAVDYVAAYNANGDTELQQSAVLESYNRQTALSVAVQMEERQFAETLFTLVQNSNDPVLREEVLRALTYSNDPVVINQLRALALSDDLRNTEVDNIIVSLMKNTGSRDETWTWLVANIDTLIERLPGWSQGRVIDYAASLCSAEYATDIESKLSEKISSLGWGPRSLANTLEQITLCDALVQHHTPAVQAFLESDN